MQERVFGGLKPSVRRLLERASEDTGGRRISRSRSATKASAGTILIRDWQGKSHHVTVLHHLSVLRSDFSLRPELRNLAGPVFLRPLQTAGC